MKAAILNKYSKHNLNLSIREVSKPKVNNNEVLIKINAAGVNPVDNMIARGEVKLVVPYKLPMIMGNEVVGKIEEIGTNVNGFNIGDRVFSRLPLNKIGGFAEFISVDANAIAHVPEYLSDEEAAAIPLTGLTVMQALELMNVSKGETIFISGGTGGVGAMAIPIAKAKGLNVITNGGLRNRERVLKLGADKFIDYKVEDYTEVLDNVDYVLDALGGDETEKQFSILKEGGHLVSLRALPNGSFARRMKFNFFKSLLFSIAGKKYDKMAEKYNAKYDFIYVESNGKQLQEIAEIFTQLEIKPSIDKVFDFKDVNKALQKVDNGGSNGKTIIKF